jgi:hypothetical protein
MTKSWEKGENEITLAARKEALRTRRPIEDVLKEMRTTAAKAGDRALRKKIERAQKYCKFRNKQRRQRRK